VFAAFEDEIAVLQEETSRVGDDELSSSRWDDHAADLQHTHALLDEPGCSGQGEGCELSPGNERVQENRARYEFSSSLCLTRERRRPRREAAATTSSMSLHFSLFEDQGRRDRNPGNPAAVPRSSQSDGNLCSFAPVGDHYIDLASGALAGGDAGSFLSQLHDVDAFMCGMGTISHPYVEDETVRESLRMPAILRDL
jgi:hypothetical protein